jgi:hypothetical protein
MWRLKSSWVSLWRWSATTHELSSGSIIGSRRRSVSVLPVIPMSPSSSSSVHPPSSVGIICRVSAREPKVLYCRSTPSLLPVIGVIRRCHPRVSLVLLSLPYYLWAN